MPTPETLFETRWLKVQRLDHWDFVRRPQADSCVGILAITPNQEIILVEQFRIPIQRRVIEIPAGIVGDEPEFLGESLAAAAARELLEETGYRAGTIEPLIATPTSAAARHGASFTPSPAMRTVAPPALALRTASAFSTGVRPARQFAIPTCEAIRAAAEVPSPVSIRTSSPRPFSARMDARDSGFKASSTISVPACFPSTEIRIPS